MLVTALVLVASARAALAQPPDRIPDVGEPTEEGRPDSRWQYPLMLFETAAIIVPPTIYYWNTVQDQMEDWEIRWTWHDWKEKLTTLDPLVLDTNRFMPNAVRHPLTGALQYQVGRANGLGPWGSLALDFVSAVFWEYVVEYRELPSVNDIFCNTVGGILIGEPLFQIGQLGEDPHAGFAESSLAFLASPFDRTQHALGWSWLRRDPTPAHALTFQVGPSIARFDGTQREELQLGLDIALVRDQAFARPGSGLTRTGLAGWNRELLDLRLGSATDASGVTSAHFRSETSYVGWYSRSIDDDGNGDGHVLSLGGGFDLWERRLRAEWDRVGVFELFGPRFGWFHRDGDLSVEAEIAAYPNVAMVQAHVFPEPLGGGLSVLRLRGYYYATGASLVARVHARDGRWDGSLDTTAHQFWSFDAHDHGGDTDPKGLTDQRAVASLRLGVRPTDGDLVVGVFGDAIWRRGTWATKTASDGELDAGVGLSVGF